MTSLQKYGLKFICCSFLCVNSLVFTYGLTAEELPLKEVTQQKSMNKTKVMSSDSSKIIINSQIKGSQEQPRVLYIMPWQGIKKPIIMDGTKRALVMPKFHPINPKQFKQQVRDYHVSQSN